MSGTIRLNGQLSTEGEMNGTVQVEQPYGELVDSNDNPIVTDSGSVLATYSIDEKITGTLSTVGNINGMVNINASLTGEV